MTGVWHPVSLRTYNRDVVMHGLEKWKVHCSVWAGMAVTELFCSQPSLQHSDWPPRSHRAAVVPTNPRVTQGDHCS